MPQVTLSHIWVANDFVYLFGGVQSGVNAISNSWRYSLTSSLWSEWASISGAHPGPLCGASFWQKGSTFYLYGGSTTCMLTMNITCTIQILTNHLANNYLVGAYYNNLWSYQSDANTWTSISSPSTPAVALPAFYFNIDTAYFFSGRTDNSKYYYYYM